jgi:hypothetical protein
MENYQTWRLKIYKEINVLKGNQVKIKPIIKKKIEFLDNLYRGIEIVAHSKKQKHLLERLENEFNLQKEKINTEIILLLLQMD